MSSALILVAAFVGLIFLMGLFLISRYKRCPSDRILVISGKTGQGSSKCIAGGATFVWPVIQEYEYLDLSPISIDVDLKSALSKQNIRIDVPSRFTVGISTEEGIMQNAAETFGKRNDANPRYRKRYYFRSIAFGCCNDGY